MKIIFQPNVHLCMYIIFAIGLLASVGLVLLAIIAAAYLLNLVITTVFEVAAHISLLYSTSDSLTRLLLILLLSYAVISVIRAIVRNRK